MMFENMIRDWFSDENVPYNEFVRALLRGDVKEMNHYRNDISMATFSFFNVGSSKSTLNAKADRPERFSMDSTLGETVAEPLAVEMFNQMEPGMLDGPMIQFAYGMTLAELIGAASQAKPMYEAVVNALNAECKINK